MNYYIVTILYSHRTSPSQERNQWSGLQLGLGFVKVMPIICRVNHKWCTFNYLVLGTHANHVARIQYCAVSSLQYGVCWIGWPEKCQCLLYNQHQSASNYQLHLVYTYYLIWLCNTNWWCKVDQALQWHPLLWRGWPTTLWMHAMYEGIDYHDVSILIITRAYRPQKGKGYTTAILDSVYVVPIEQNSNQIEVCS